MKGGQAKFEPHTQAPQEIKESLRYSSNSKIISYTKYILPLFCINMNITYDINTKYTSVKEKYTVPLRYPSKEPIR